MSGDGSVTITWADGDYAFRLPLGQLRELQEKCNAGPAAIAGRIMDQQWRIDDLRETIRLGLIGGGMPPAAALSLTRRYVDERPLMEAVPVAQAVLMAALVGVPDDEVGQSGKERGEEIPMTESSASPSSTEQEQPSDGRLSKSTQ